MVKVRKNKIPASFAIEFDREEDGRWIAEISKLPGVMAYGANKSEARQKVSAIALRTLADRVEQGNASALVTHLFKYGMARR